MEEYVPEESGLDDTDDVQIELLAELRYTNKLLAQVLNRLTEPAMRDANYFEKDI